MKISLRVKDKESGEFIDDTDRLMDAAGLDLLMGYEDIGVQSDGTAVVFDKCGNFGYLNPDRFQLIIMSDF